MKKIIAGWLMLVAIVFCCFAEAASAGTVFDWVGATSLSGDANSLNVITRTVKKTKITDGTLGIVAIKGGTTSFYIFDKDSTDRNAPPGVVVPRWNTSGKGAWKISGTNGSPGSAWNFGAGVPAGGLASLGDFYIRTTNSDIYSKTGVAEWTLIGNIKGATGAAGAAGADGAGIVAGALSTTQLAADPADPIDGDWVLWVSDGTAAGDAGDVMMKITVGATTKTVTVVDFSAAP